MLALSKKSGITEFFYNLLILSFSLFKITHKKKLGVTRSFRSEFRTRMSP
jgi:hypothetical protein